MLELEVDQSSLVRLVAALDEEDDGAKLRRDLARNLRVAGREAAEATRADLRSMGSAGLPHEGESLREYVADQVKIDARLAGDRAGVRIYAGSKGPRKFRHAARRLNKAAGWRHPVYGRHGVWVHQVGRPDWFDRPIKARREEYRAAVLAAMRESEARLSRMG